ncbi:MFS transporter [Prochlorococcus marinus]|uniref:Possible multidrug efflux transporter, MFS family n=1 Tax=Prochlorococcus marinus (strain MIT 9211) TaxID=93059 RepID=A9BB65_PROM4|nr:MFS transporter [Prochlorococcus marinus]ABX09077.1 possible multidrug efflux transporter, MFS family [Prochlorococcus marinus str. MIT 9211]
MNVLKTTPKLKSWWNQFPPKLRLLTRGRFFASVGAGGVLYLTPLVFNDLSFSASEIGSGLTAAAIAGTITRLITGLYLDKGVHLATPLKIAAINVILADCILLSAHSYSAYVIGELFLGAAAGVYWPSVELAVPASCESFQSSKGFALVRSADALGVSIGALIGAFSALIDAIRLIYCLEIICMFGLIALLDNIKSFHSFKSIGKSKEELSKLKSTQESKDYIRFIPKLFPILVVSLLSTGILSLLQSALPIDLVLGGVNRPAINNSSIGILIAIQLSLLLLIQWPIGNWLTKKDVRFGLGLSLYSFSIGCLLLSLSSIFKEGLILTAIGLIAVSIGLASFLPTATEAIVQISPERYRGITMAVYSQCFGISALLAPLIAGIIIDTNGNAVLLWSLTSFCCIAVTPLIQKIKPIIT